MGSLQNFLFREIGASGFGLMRMGWAAVILAYGVSQIPDTARYFSEGGLLPAELEMLVTRSELRLTILHFITDPRAVLLLHLLLLLAALCMLMGQFPRLMTWIAVLLLFSFHERNPLSLGGGDTVLRHVGFFLLLAPASGAAFSLGRLAAQWGGWRGSRRLLPPVRMPIWPQRLLLWQLIVIYVTSGWDKLLGDMWIDGTAVASALHHTHFVRWPMFAMDLFGLLSPAIGVATLLFEFLWLGLLLPAWALQIFGLTPRTVKHALLIAGVLFHGGIFILMDVGSFSWAMMVAYLGLLDEEDFTAMRAWWNQKWNGTIAVLYDGTCGLCLRSVFVLALLDSLHRLRLVDFRDAAARKRTAPEISLEDLDRALHIKLPPPPQLKTKNDPLLTLKGFDAFRALCWHLPALWPLAPALYLPCVAPIGRRIYFRIAERRSRCSHKSCMM